MQRCDTCQHCEQRTASWAPKGIRLVCGAPVPDWVEEETRDVKPDDGRFCDCWTEKP